MSAETVGPVLQAGEVADAIVRAILLAHPDAQVIDRGAYLRVLVPERCSLAREAMLEALASFRWPADLESVMSSFKGFLDLGPDAAVWTAHP